MSCQRFLHETLLEGRNPHYRCSRALCLYMCLGQVEGNMSIKTGHHPPKGFTSSFLQSRSSILRNPKAPTSIEITRPPPPKYHSKSELHVSPRTSQHHVHRLREVASQMHAYQIVRRNRSLPERSPIPHGMCQGSMLLHPK